MKKRICMILSVCFILSMLFMVGCDTSEEYDETLDGILSDTVTMEILTENITPKTQRLIFLIENHGWKDASFGEALKMIQKKNGDTWETIPCGSYSVYSTAYLLKRGRSYEYRVNLEPWRGKGALEAGEYRAILDVGASEDGKDIFAVGYFTVSLTETVKAKLHDITYEGITSETIKLTCMTEHTDFHSDISFLLENQSGKAISYQPCFDLQKKRFEGWHIVWESIPVDQTVSDRLCVLNHGDSAAYQVSLDDWQKSGMLEEGEYRLVLRVGEDENGKAVFAAGEFMLPSITVHRLSTPIEGVISEKLKMTVLTKAITPETEIVCRLENRSGMSVSYERWIDLQMKDGDSWVSIPGNQFWRYGSFLDADESVELTVPLSDFPPKGTWTLKNGEYRIVLGFRARDFIHDADAYKEDYAPLFAVGTFSIQN